MSARKIKKRSSPGKIRKKAKITGNILIGDLVSKYPATSEVLLKYGLHCVGCMISPYETLKAGAKVHGIPLEPLLKDINKVVKR